MARTKSVEKSVSTIDSISGGPGEAVALVIHEASQVLSDGKDSHKWQNKVVHKETWIKTADGWQNQAPGRSEANLRVSRRSPAEEINLALFACVPQQHHVGDNVLLQHPELLAVE